jgi:hypothetical protein
MAARLILAGGHDDFRDLEISFDIVASLCEAIDGDEDDFGRCVRCLVEMFAEMPIPPLNQACAKVMVRLVVMETDRAVSRGIDRDVYEKGAELLQNLVNDDPEVVEYLRGQFEDNSAEQVFVLDELVPLTAESVG